MAEMIIEPIEIRKTLHFQHSGLEFTLDYFPGSFLIYQCLNTPMTFRSTTYKLKEFNASNGVTLASKNSPVIVSPDLIFFQGAYEDFSLKPCVYHIGNQGRFDHMCREVRKASLELLEHLKPM